MKFLRNTLVGIGIGVVVAVLALVPLAALWVMAVIAGHGWRFLA